MKIERSKKASDVALLLEGTYPFVRGGVSNWVHDIINGLPEYTFSLIFIGGSRQSYGKIQFDIPPNVTCLESYYLMDGTEAVPSTPVRGSAAAHEELAKIHDIFRKGGGIPEETIKNIVNLFGPGCDVDLRDFMRGYQSWNRITGGYNQYCYDPSFIDYFWTIRSMHTPLFRIAQIALNAPAAKLCHSVSTGYAGFLGMMLKYKRDMPYILTEHGNYTKERKIDLAGADWISDQPENAGPTPGHEIRYIRRLWIRFFEGLGTLSYQAANPIITIYEGNRQKQISDGADPDRTMVIHNGIDIERFRHGLENRDEKPPRVLGLIGRVVPIKDVKTFIRAMRTICNRIPDAEGWVVGPQEEDLQYTEECIDLVSSLGLEGKVKFLGFQSVEEILPRLGLVVLTSISEAMPLVLLEGFAGGTPALATDVGSCREIIEGSTPEDKALGSAGAVAPIADPEAVAQAASELLLDENKWKAAQAAGLRRVRQFYRKDILLDRYRQIYKNALELAAEREGEDRPSFWGKSPLKKLKEAVRGGHRI